MQRRFMLRLRPNEAEQRPGRSASLAAAVRPLQQRTPCSANGCPCSTRARVRPGPPPASASYCFCSTTEPVNVPFVVYVGTRVIVFPETQYEYAIPSVSSIVITLPAIV